MIVRLAGTGNEYIGSESSRNGKYLMEQRASFVDAHPLIIWRPCGTTIILTMKKILANVDSLKYPTPSVSDISQVTQLHLSYTHHEAMGSSPLSIRHRFVASSMPGESSSNHPHFLRKPSDISHPVTSQGGDHAMIPRRSTS